MSKEKVKAAKTTEETRAEVNALSKEALELEQQLNYAEGLATRTQKDFEKTQNEESRKTALTEWTKAWRISKKIAEIKEKIHCESKMLYEVEKALYEQVDKNKIGEAYLYKSNSDYYAGMSKRNAEERDKMLKIKQKCMDNIKQLRRTAPTTSATA